MICIYKITTPLGKIYIGKTNNLKKRINSYRSLHCKTQKLLYRSFVKYGFDNCKIDIVESAIEVVYGAEREIFWIKHFNSFYYESKNGLNLTKGGEGVGEHITDSHREKIIKSNSLRTVSIETRKKMSEKRKRRLYNPETGIKISKSLTGKSKGKGKILTNLHKENIIKNSPKNKIVCNLENGELFINIREASKRFNINRSTLKNYLSGKRTNKTQLAYA